MYAALATPLTSRDPHDRFFAVIRGRGGLFAPLLRMLLWLASGGYAVAVFFRNLAYTRGWVASHAAAVPVVSVGNLSVGGTGKTPMVEFVARYYRRHDQRVAILSRGYGAEQGRNDEALVLEESLPDVPHLQGADRVALAAAAVEELESEVLVLDDGFQHRRLKRDLDLVLIDATDPWGCGHLLPRGLLREPAGSLRRADAVILTRCDQVDDVAHLRADIARIAPGVPVAEAVHQPEALLNASGTTHPLDLLRQRPVLAFCGIGNPEAFRRTLVDLGCRPVEFRTYPDHHDYTRADVEALAAADLPADALLVTTHKDLVKVRVDALGGRPLWAVTIALHFRHGQADVEALLARLIRE